MSIPNLQSLSKIIPLGSEGAQEFARLICLLLNNEFGYRFLTFSDASGDYKGVDAIQDETIGYQYKFYPCPFSSGHRSKIKQSFENALENFEEMTEWVLVSPDNMMKDDVSWFNSLKSLLPENNKQIKLSHLGHDKIAMMLEKVPAIGYRYYREAFSNSFREAMLLPELMKLLDDAIDKIKNFKPRSALDTLLIIKEAALNHITEQRFLARIHYAIGLAKTELENIETASKDFLSAYELDKNNFEIKTFAAKALFYIDRREEARRIAIEIRSKDPLNETANAILFCLDDSKHTSDEIKKISSDLLLSKEFIVMLNNHFYSIEKPFLTNQILDIYLQKPDPLIEITFNNKSKWMVLSALLFSKAESENSYLSLDGINQELAHSEKTRLANLYLKALISTLGNTEIAHQIIFHRVLLHYGNFILTGNITEIESIKDLLPQISEKNKDITQQLIFKGYVQSAQYHKALEITTQTAMERYETFLPIKSMLQFNSDKKDDARKSALNYISQDDFRVNIGNISFIFFYSRKILTTPAERTELFESLSKRNCFLDALSKVYVEISIAFDNQLSKDEIAIKINNVRPLIQSGTESEKQIAALFYFNIACYEEVIDLLYGTISEEYESDSLECLILALFETGKYPKKCLYLFDKWRNNFKPRLNVIRAEINACFFLKDWNRAEVVTEYYYNNFPNDRKAALFQLLRIYHNTDNEEKAKKTLHKLAKENLTWQQAKILVKSALDLHEFDFAADLIWLFAYSLTNIEAKKWLISFIGDYGHNIPELGLEIKEGRTDVVVVYECNGSVKQTIIDPNNRFAANFIGKKPGEQFMVVDSQDGSLNKYRVSRFIHKFHWLSEKIFEEFSNDSSSGLKPIDVADHTIEAFEKKISEQFGFVEEQKREAREKTILMYMNNQESITMVALTCFNGNPLDTAYSLFQSPGYSFRTFPEKLSAVHYNNQSIPVLDFYSLILLFELSKEGIPIKGPFIISPLIISFLENEIDNLKYRQQPKISLQVSINAVTPILYDDTFYQRRMSLFDRMLSWVKENCNTVVLTNKLAFRRSLEMKSSGNPFYNQYILDTAILGAEDGHLLITDDSFLTKMFNGSGIIGIEAYLLKTISSEWHQKIMEEFVERKVVGVQVNEDVLYNSYLSRLKGKNTFDTAIQNIRPDINGETGTIIIALKFAKKLLLDSFLPQSDKRRVITSVFQIYLNGLKKFVPIDSWPLLHLRNTRTITEHFYLLPIQNQFVQDCYSDAVSIITHN